MDSSFRRTTIRRIGAVRMTKTRQHCLRHHVPKYDIAVFIPGRKAQMMLRVGGIFSKFPGNSGET
eukprot:CAMPEP_0175043978 /NCGR_PEP_ID=MMETSP0052_2-20121109/3525_1 /TAXON_ID=51329 ORGANISM="Polytomella parva, Strain SAG 63-3" /NCGR_SAMPLE_ID=MMETSP0052_2 /ASSEMBLY_ACC=CAM_ASM_000194 /LENGTH=64 /DNA_ID=CAMNT_0016307173 /DNA_START=257 /DNA_END=451 /DNA_ORIENTATION=-